MLVPFFWSSHKSRWPLPCLFHSLTQSRQLYLVGPLLLVISQVPLAPTSPVSFSHTKQTSLPCWSCSSGHLTSPTGPDLACLIHLIISHKADNYTLLVPFFWSSHKSRWPLTLPVSFILLSHTKKTSIPCRSRSSGLTSPAGPCLTCLILSHKADLLPCWSRSSGCLTRPTGPLPVSLISFSHTKQTPYLVGPVLLVVSQVPLAPYLACLIHLILSHKADLTLLVPFFWLSRKSSRQVRSVISDWLMLPASFRRSPALRVRLVRSLPARSTSES